MEHIMLRNRKSPHILFSICALLAVCGLLIMGLGVQGALAAEASPIDEGVYVIRSKVGGRSLDIAGGSYASGTNVQVYESVGAARQYWRIEKSGDHYTICNSFSGVALDVTGAGMEPGTNVQVYSANSTLAQSWDFVRNDDGSYTIVSALSGCVLDVAGAGDYDGANVQVYESNQSSAQRWELEKVEPVIADGVYTISTSLDGNMVLDVNGASMLDGARVQIWSSNGSRAQIWGVRYDERTGFYTIVSAQSGKSIDIPSGIDAAGIAIQQYAYNGTTAQLWRLIRNEDDGTITIQSVISGMVLDVPSALAASGARPQTWSSNGTNAQRWNFSATNISLNGIYQFESAIDASYVVEAEASSTASDARIQVGAVTGALNQKWELESLGEGVHSIRNANTGLYLADAGGSLVGVREVDGTSQWSISVGYGGLIFMNVSTGRVIDLYGANASQGNSVAGYEPNGTMAQVWIPVSASLVEEGCYFFFNRGAEGLQALDVPSASTSNGVALQTYESNETAAQKWLVESDGNGWYTIRNVGSGLALDVRGAATISGTTVQQHSSNGSNAQLWRFEIGPEGGVAVYSRLGDLALTAGDGDVVSGAPVTVKTPNMDSAFSWTLEETAYVVDEEDIWGDSAYIEQMRSRAVRWGSSTSRPTEWGMQTGSVTGWCCTVDLDRGRVCVFRREGSRWNLVRSYNAYVGAFNSKRGSKSNTFSGVWTMQHKSRALWDEAWGGIDCNDWFSCFIEAWSPTPTSYANRYFEGKGYDDGQGFHHVGYTDGNWQRTQGCVGLTYDESKWIYDNVPLETPVVVFASYDNGAY